MTKYVLNSGGLRNEPEKAREFFAEVVKGLGDSPKVLLCFFAQKREDWESKFVHDQEWLATFMPEGVAPIFKLAFPETFSKQVQECDAIYIHGGDDHLLMYWLKQLDVPRAWEGKVVATNSASSDAVSAAFWTCDWRACMEGLGILPIKFIPHYDSAFGADDPRGPIDWEAGKKELEQYGDTSLPIYALKEGEFAVIEQ